MFCQGQLAVHGLAILLGRNEAGISNRGKNFLHHAVQKIQLATVTFSLHRSMSGRQLVEHLFDKFVKKEDDEDGEEKGDSGLPSPAASEEDVKPTEGELKKEAETDQGCNSIDI